MGNPETAGYPDHGQYGHGLPNRYDRFERQIERLGCRFSLAGHPILLLEWGFVSIIEEGPLAA